jgi:hypothetical protein
MREVRRVSGLYSTVGRVDDMNLFVLDRLAGRAWTYISFFSLNEQIKFNYTDRF